MSIQGDVEMGDFALGSTVPGGAWTSEVTSTGSLVMTGDVSVEGDTHRFAPGKQLTVQGDLAADGVIFKGVDPVVNTSDRWGGIVVEGGGSFTVTDAQGATMVKESLAGVTVEEGGTADLTGASMWNNTVGFAVAGDLTASGVTVEGAATGVVVYDPGTAVITGGEIRDNGLGIDVLSDAGVTVSGTTLTRNTTAGIRSGIPETIDGGVFCVGACRSTFALEGAQVVGNYGIGVLASNAENVRITDLQSDDEERDQWERRRRALPLEHGGGCVSQHLR